jgi:hypothetical protein
MLMAILDKIGPEKQRISERLMRVEQRRSRSDFLRPNLQRLKIRSDGPEIREMSVQLGDAI